MVAEQFQGDEQDNHLWAKATVYRVRAGFDGGVTGEPLVRIKPIQAERMIGCCQCPVPCGQRQKSGEDKTQNCSGIAEQRKGEAGAGEMGYSGYRPPAAI